MNTQNNLRRLLVTSLLLVLGVLPSMLKADIVRITLDDTIIHPISAEYIGRSIDYANSHGADAILICLSTPGGLEDSMREIIEKIVTSRVPVIIYVSPSGARAASAGFFILLSADVAIMAPGTNTGSAHPVAINPLSGTSIPLDEIMKKKIEEDSAAYMRSLAQKRGRNVEIAEKGVTEAKSYSDSEALANHLIDAVCNSTDEILDRFDGRSVRRFDGSTTVLHLKGKPIVDVAMTLRQRFLDKVLNPNIALVLGAVGVLGLYAEFSHPGLIFPGVGGAIALVMALFSFHLLPINYVGVIMIFLAIVLFVLEAKIVSHGILAIGGILSGVIGSLILIDSPIPELQIHKVTAFAVFLPLALITVFLLRLVLLARKLKSVTGEQGMLGLEGVAYTPIGESGKVYIRGEYWNASSDTPIEKGQPVVVTAIQGLKIIVKPKGPGPQ
jgi:membrane-bound serine protease (ClpP class)